MRASRRLKVMRKIAERAGFRWQRRNFRRSVPKMAGLGFRTGALKALLK